MTAEPDLLPSSIAAFTEALHGDRGSLDAWLEVNDEREVRAHVEAYARANINVATAAQAAEIEALRAEVAEWKRVATAQAELHGDFEARADRLAKALRDAHEALADAANTMYAICGESQFCDSCTAFERANQWRQDWHGGDPLLQQITDALEQESNDA